MLKVIRNINRYVSTYLTEAKFVYALLERNVLLSVVGVVRTLRSYKAVRQQRNNAKFRNVNVKDCKGTCGHVQLCEILSSIT